MDTATGFKVARVSAGRVANWIHAKFLWLLLASHVVAGLFPAWGLMLPIIFYNLVQHLVAGVVDRWLGKADGATRSTSHGQE